MIEVAEATLSIFSVSLSLYTLITIMSEMKSSIKSELKSEIKNKIKSEIKSEIKRILLILLNSLNSLNSKQVFLLSEMTKEANKRKEAISVNVIKATVIIREIKMTEGIDIVVREETKDYDVTDSAR